MEVSIGGGKEQGKGGWGRGERRGAVTVNQVSCCMVGEETGTSGSTKRNSPNGGNHHKGRSEIMRLYVDNVLFSMDGRKQSQVEGKGGGR